MKKRREKVLFKRANILQANEFWGSHTDILYEVSFSHHWVKPMHQTGVVQGQKVIEYKDTTVECFCSTLRMGCV